MPDIFLNEAARLSGHDERVIRDWIKKGDLPERKIKVNGRLKHVLDLDTFEAYLQSRDTGYIRHNPAQSDNSDLTAKVTDLEQRVSTLEDLVYALQEARARTEHPSGPPTPPQRKMAPEREKRPYTHKRESNQPPDTITMAQLAKELNITPRTLQEHVMKRNFDHIAIFKRKRGDIEEYERYFTEEQAEYVKAWHAQIKKS